MKKTLSLLLTVVFSLTAITACSAETNVGDVSAVSKTLVLQIDNPIMTVDDEEKEIDPGRGTVPIILNDRTLLPVRAVVEEIGGSVDWDDETQTVFLEYQGDIITLAIDNTTAFFNEAINTLDTAPTIINDRTMLPIRFIMESFGYTVLWDGEKQTVTIFKPSGNSIINASEIWNKYDKNPEKYEATYDGELENVTGVVAYIGTDSHGTPSMEIADVKGGTSYVLGVFGSFDEMSAVSVGDTVTISGYFHIMSSENMVVLKRCEIKDIYKAENAISDRMNFGKYYTDKAGTSLEPIEWIVLDSQNDRVLLLAKECIDSLPWHNTHESITWDNCDLRSWLNGEFLQSAFTAEEQERILLSDLDNGDDLGYWTSVGNNTKDKVFLLSGKEIEKYLPLDESRAAKPTAYAVSHGAYSNGSGDCAWWLRSPGMTETSPAYLSSAGDIGSRAHEANEKIIGVRPAIWIKK